MSEAPDETLKIIGNHVRERRRTVSDVIVEAMALCGVKHVWGVVSRSNLGLADAVRRQAELGRLSFYGVRHEGAAGIAASAYGRLTGRPAACLSGAGGGAANLLAGLMDAVLGRSPVLALAGQFDPEAVGSAAGPETESDAVLRAVARWTELVRQESPYAELVESAIDASIRERGVSCLVVPQSLQLAPVHTEAPVDPAVHEATDRKSTVPGDTTGAKNDSAPARLTAEAHASGKRRNEESRREAPSDSGLSPASVGEALARHLPGDSIITVDAGDLARSVDRCVEPQERIVLVPGASDSIGFSTPAAMGAWAATREEDTPYHGRKVVSISGDGGSARYMAELATAVRYRMNITHLLLNDMGMSGTARAQRSAGLDVWETDLWNPHFGLWARNCGAMGVRVTRIDEIDLALERAIAHPCPSLVEVMVA